MKGESGGRRSPKSQTVVTADSLVRTFCSEGFSWRFNEKSNQMRSCSSLDKVPNLCHGN